MMKQSGRVHWLTITGIAAGLFIAFVLVFAPPTPGTAASNFMVALAKGDANALTDLTYLNGSSKEEVKQKWDLAVNHGAEHYRFLYKVSDSKEFANNTATVKVLVNRNYRDGGFDYDDKYELPMEKEDGKWKVHVQAVSREMFPFLPR